MTHDENNEGGMKEFLIAVTDENNNGRIR